MKKILQIITAIGLLATSSTTVVACDLGFNSKPNLVILKSKINEAKDIRRRTKSRVAWNKLQEMIDYAKGIAGTDPFEEWSKTITNWLNEAMTEFNNSPDITNLQSLKVKIEQAKIKEIGDKTQASFNLLLSAIVDASLIDNEFEAEAAELKLDEAIAKFDNSSSTPNLDALKLLIIEAENIQRNEKTEDAWNKFQTEIERVKQIKTEKAVLENIFFFKKAIKWFLDSADIPNLNALKARIVQAKKIQRNDKSLVAWNELQSAIYLAEREINEATAEETKNKLELEIIFFNNSLSIPNLNALYEKIMEAQLIKIGRKTLDSYEQLQSAIATAINVYSEQKAASAQNILNDAIKTFEISPIIPNTDNLAIRIQQALQIEQGIRSYSAWSIFRGVVFDAQENALKYDQVELKARLDEAIITFYNSPTPDFDAFNNRMLEINQFNKYRRSSTTKSEMQHIIKTIKTEISEDNAKDKLTTLLIRYETFLNLPKTSYWILLRIQVMDIAKQSKIRGYRSLRLWNELKSIIKIAEEAPITISQIRAMTILSQLEIAWLDFFNSPNKDTIALNQKISDARLLLRDSPNNEKRAALQTAIDIAEAVQNEDVALSASEALNDAMLIFNS